jgi:ribonuclease D
MLRDWRSRRSHKEGMPSFLILNNRQLAAISAAQPASLTALRGVEGIGESRSIRWGQEILGVVAAALGRSVEQATPSPATDTGATASSKSVHESEMPEVSEPVYVAQSVPAVQPTLFSAEGENVS